MLPILKLLQLQKDFVTLLFAIADKIFLLFLLLGILDNNFLIKATFSCEIAGSLRLRVVAHRSDQGRYRWCLCPGHNWKLYVRIVVWMGLRR